MSTRVYVVTKFINEQENVKCTPDELDEAISLLQNEPINGDMVLIFYNQNFIELNKEYAYRAYDELVKSPDSNKALLAIIKNILDSSDKKCSVVHINCYQQWRKFSLIQWALVSLAVDEDGW